jgi:hypothetical protein
LQEASLADAAHEQEVLCASEAPEALTVLDDARGERGADAWKPLQLFARGFVEGDEGLVLPRLLRVCLL